MISGTVKFFNTAKGFGFIVPLDGGADVFFHKSAVDQAGIKALVKGQPLMFDTEVDEKGLKQAAKLQLDPEKGFNPTGIGPLNCPRPSKQKKEPEPIERSDKATIFAPSVSKLGRGRTIDRELGGNNPSNWRRTYERYCELARNANGDCVGRENYWQYAEHYLRMLNGSAFEE